MARWWWWWVSWVVDKDEFAEVELVGESFPFSLVQNTFVVIIPENTMLSVQSIYATSLCTGYSVCLCACLSFCLAVCLSITNATCILHHLRARLSLSKFMCGLPFLSPHSLANLSGSRMINSPHSTPHPMAPTSPRPNSSNKKCHSWICLEPGL